MANNNEIVNIGGVRFQKNDIITSETKKKDGKDYNSVFLRDGTHIEYPNQAKNNEATVSIDNKMKKSNKSYNIENGEYSYDPVPPPVDEPGVIRNKYPSGEVKVSFYRMNGAKITGTSKKDDYTLFGCQNTKVDVSQDDNSDNWYHADNVRLKDDTNKHGPKGIKGIFTGEKVPERNQHSVDGKVFVSGNNEVKQGKWDKTYKWNSTGTLWDQGYKPILEGEGTAKEK